MARPFEPVGAKLTDGGQISSHRADASIAREAALRLQQSAYPELTRVTCEFHDGILTLRGIVSSYFLRQLARISVTDIDGVREIRDQLQVR